MIGSSGGGFERQALINCKQQSPHDLESTLHSFMSFAVYSSPEAGLTASNQPSSILNKFTGRKSGRQRQFMKQSMSQTICTLNKHHVV